MMVILKLLIIGGTRFLGRALLVRAGLLVGSFCLGDRFTYWLHRAAPWRRGIGSWESECNETQMDASLSTGWFLLSN